MNHKYIDSYDERSFSELASIIGKTMQKLPKSEFNRILKLIKSL